MHERRVCEYVLSDDVSCFCLHSKTYCKRQSWLGLYGAAKKGKESTSACDSSKLGVRRSLPKDIGDGMGANKLLRHRTLQHRYIINWYSTVVLHACCYTLV